MSTETPSPDILALVADIVAAHVSNNNVPIEAVPALITTVHTSLVGLGNEPEAVAPRPEPAVSVRASVKPDYLISLESGRKLKMLKRYLLTSYGMTPDDYRRKWDLPSDYPMVAPNYAAQRKELAHRIGLGHKRTPEPVEPVEAPRRRQSRKVADAE
ncbi:MucR family transcriptional regulator [Sphingomonas solaris]|uniref:MucR family transcriptional regulator n=1 Tax=Alterirhizorhabdus solaris TaxID=2529389 RepID=A0A558RCM3_9SPHN|nr:MucR family transcriptional regulator [Sphingomonas solaris]TVV77225.1 MucR family transcriptional regulator [Sphingomonas solaris]